MTTLIEGIDDLHLATRRHDETAALHIVLIETGPDADEPEPVDAPAPRPSLRSRMLRVLVSLYATLRRAAAPTGGAAARRVRRVARAVWMRLPNVRTQRMGRHAAGLGPSTLQRVRYSHVIRRHRAVRVFEVPKARARDFTESSMEEVLAFWTSLTDPAKTGREPAFVSHIKR